MARKLCVVGVLLALIVVMGDTTRAQDARSVLQAAVRAMGAANVKTIQYSGTGWNAGVGQSFSPQDDWPRFEVTRYTRTIDYDARSSREEFTRRQGNNPPTWRWGHAASGRPAASCDRERQFCLEHGWPESGTADRPVSSRDFGFGLQTTRHPVDAARIPEGGTGREPDGHLVDAAGIAGRYHAEWKGDARLVHCNGKVQSQWDLQ